MNKRAPRGGRARPKAPERRLAQQRARRAEPAPAEPAVAERVQKVLARAGIGSRRQIEQWIEEGRITVNGVAAQLGQRVTPQDRVELDGRVIERLGETPKARVLIYHKPVGELVTRSDEARMRAPEAGEDGLATTRPTVFEKLPRLRGGRWIAIGRLDYNTAGLLLFTTDGELAHRLMHPSHEIEREYAVRVLGEVSAEALAQLTREVMLDDGPACFDSLMEAGGEGANRWYHVVLSEGRNREVRRMWEAVGAKVSRLIRVRFGPVGLPRHLRPGRAEDLAPELMTELYRMVGLTPPAVPVVVEKERRKKTLRLSASKAARPGAERARGARSRHEKRGRGR